MKKIIFCITINLLILLLVGCSKKGLIRETGDVKFPASHRADKSVVYIFRPGTERGNFKHDIFVDNAVDSKNYVGYNMGGEYIYFYLSPGKHRIHSHAEYGAWIDIYSEGGKAYFVEQLKKGGGNAGNSMKFINEKSAKRWIKKLRPGRIIRKEH
ncbi:hypothetical protein ACFL20_09915 [Spirochaetota bacterium]